jgi:type II secretory pathway pseudopilin PulG
LHALFLRDGSYTVSLNEAKYQERCMHRSLCNYLMRHRHMGAGLTLIEVAISLSIIALIAAFLLAPITTQVTQSRITQARADLDQINEALIGFALAQGKPRLPCPDATTGGGANDGLEDCGAFDAAKTIGGNIPWATLNLPATDPWGQHYQYRVNSAYTDKVNGFTLNTAPTGTCNAAPPGNAAGTGNLFTTAGGQLRICGNSACTSTLANTTVPAIVFSRGPNGITAPTSIDEIENINNDCLFVSRTYSSASGNEFDDLIAWMSPGILKGRMVTAQKLP